MGEGAQAEPLCLPGPVALLVDQPLHPVHGLDRVEPALPPTFGQILAHPGGLQLLQGVKVAPWERKRKYVDFFSRTSGHFAK